MQTHFLFRFVALAIGGGAICSAALGRAAEGQVDYVREIKPILQSHCYACHGSLVQKSGLRLDTAELLRKGGDGGAAIVAGKSAESRLFVLVSRLDDVKMPPEGEGTPLTPAEVALLKRWIDQGAQGPAEERPQPDPRTFWSYQMPVRPPLPAVKNAAWVRTPIDAFIAAGHEQHGLQPRPEAPREVWLRRVYFDLIGLPPRRDELRAFLAETSPDAYEQVVDRLLARPEYGERWGRHWMDVWRYSDWYGSRGINEIRYSQRHIWRWRDWIIESLNADQPYDRMVLEMLAGDELEPANPSVLRATGFLGRNWYKFDRNVWMFDTVEHTSQAFLGLTLKCCRCHDHKYDPISQEDYYRFRAFFEPHDVRTDALAAGAPTEKDATLGQVLKEGVARVFDKQLDAPTYLLQRGDNRYPDETRRLNPGVPAALGHRDFAVEPVKLPAEAFYPALRPFMLASLREQARNGEVLAKQAHDAAQLKVAAAQHKVKEFAARQGEPPTDKPDAPSPPAFHDDFAKARPEVWKAASGNWTYENGRLVLKTPGNFATFVASASHPRDFKARWKFRPLEAGKLRSIGFSFDRVDDGNSQDVYMHVNDESQGIQAFHRQGGAQHYPPAGIVKTSGLLKVGEVATVEIDVRGSQLAIWLNGQKQLDYPLPVPRRDGKFALWAHEATVEFLELEIRELVPTLDDLKREAQIAAQAVELAQRKILIAQLEAASVEARIVAEQAKYGGRAEAELAPLALLASRAERAVALATAEEAVLAAEQQLALVKLGPATPQPTPAVVEADKRLAMARQVLAAAQRAADNPDGKYAPLGEQFPATSTGRRLALARWIADARNPRTSRIAVNHLWLRHFGAALVSTVENFGLNGREPTHPELLDWLAQELAAQGWRMKPLHRQIVLSSTYRMSSADGDSASANLTADRENRYLWRMNSRRLEAEAVRDGVLYAAGALDQRLGGQEIPEAEGQTNFRRSLYFRNTPNEKMKLLEVFDVADPNACYRRRESVVPQQALALMNSALALDRARSLAERLTAEVGPDDNEHAAREFISTAFETVLSRAPTAAETAACLKFLKQNAQVVATAGGAAFPAGGQSARPPAAVPHLRARENLLLVLFSHNDFVTVR